jgi:hypothetical protein
MQREAARGEIGGAEHPFVRRPTPLGAENHGCPVARPVPSIRSHLLFPSKAHGAIGISWLPPYGGLCSCSQTVTILTVQADDRHERSAGLTFSSRRADSDPTVGLLTLATLSFWCRSRSRARICTGHAHRLPHAVRLPASPRAPRACARASCPWRAVRAPTWKVASIRATSTRLHEACAATKQAAPG